MDELIIKEMLKRGAGVLILFLLSSLVAIFFVIGVYDGVWNVPAKRAEIVELTQKAESWENRAHELERYIADQDKKYRVAIKYYNLFMMAADPKMVMDFSQLEEYLKSKKEFFESNQEDLKP